MIEPVPDKKYQIITVGGVRSCTCPGYRYRGKCKHLSHTPAELSKMKREAAKAGKVVAEQLKGVKAYESNQSKIDNDPELQEFLNILNG